jgi:lysophospholipase
LLLRYGSKGEAFQFPSLVILPFGEMKSGTLSILVALVASTYTLYALAAGLEARAFAANAPHGYTPQTSKCPSNAPTIRSASSLSVEETTWLEQRRPATVEPMRDLLSRLKITGLDTEGYINKHQSNFSALPNVALAISGGGYRAMLNGAGVLEAFDSRTPNSTSTGQLGGLLQSATYLSGTCNFDLLYSTLT